MTNLRFEVGHSSNPATGINMRDQLVYILNRCQEELSLNWDYPGLVVDRDIPLTIGARYYNYPSDLPFEAVSDIWLIYDTIFGRLEYGIGPEQFNLWNSALGFTSWPVERWMNHSDDGTLEVWPVPSEAPPGTASTQSARLRLRGTRVVQPMVQDSDTCVLPATVLVLFAAAEVLAREKSPDAGLKLQKAQEYLRRYKVRQSAHKTDTFVIGGGTSGYSRGRVGLEYIPEGYGKGPG